MTHAIRSQLHLCRIGADFVGLDLASNRYTLFRGHAATLLDRFRDGAADEVETAWLVDHGIVQRGEMSAPQFGSDVPPPTASFAPHRKAPVHPLLTIRAMAAQVRAQRATSRYPLSRTLRTLHDLTRGGRRARAEDCADVAAAFLRARRYLSQTDQCLVCSAAMVGLLARYGWRVRLVIGVTLPFTAHCWVQAGETVICDDLDRIRGFTPILAI